MRLVFIALIVLIISGCCGPLVRVAADANVIGKLQPMAPDQPVKSMPLPHRPHKPDCGKIAIVDVDGLLLNTDMTGLGSLGENPVALFRERLEAIAADHEVCAVVVRINSPGGGVTASDIMWHDLEAFKAKTHLPVIACLMDLGAGGSYYLATAADEVIAHPTTVTGGIGVILNLYNLQDTMAQFNIVGAPVKSGANIDLGTPITPLSAEKRKLLQTMADEFHERFRKIVVQNRPKVDSDEKTNFDGRVFTAEQALSRGLIDSIGYLDDAICAARHAAGAPGAQVVFYHRNNDKALSTYSITPNTPLQATLLPLSLPGVDRSKLPSFLYLWQPEPTLERLGGK